MILIIVYMHDSITVFTHPPFAHDNLTPVAERQKTMAALWWSALGVEAFANSYSSGPSYTSYK